MTRRVGHILLTCCKDDGRHRGQVEHESPGRRWNRHVGHQRSEDADADDELVDAAQRSAHLRWGYLVSHTRGYVTLAAFVLMTQKRPPSFTYPLVC